jgi:hypothetical protein
LVADLGHGGGAANTERFADWVQRRLVPRLRSGDIVVLDNLAAHKEPAARTLIEGCGLNSTFFCHHIPFARFRSKPPSARIALFVHGTAETAVPC